MPDARASIEKHYGFDGLADRIMAALEAAGHDTANLTVEMLNLVDQMHFGGLNSTKRQAEALGLVKGMRDAGSAARVGTWLRPMDVGSKRSTSRRNLSRRRHASMSCAAWIR
jgi:hypothetical protein